MEAFSRAFLAAGAAATVTLLWRNPDQATADFMTQFYYHLAQGESKGAALRAAKLQLVHSGLALSHPHYLTAFVWNGDGWNSTTRPIPWSAVAAAVILLGALATKIVRSIRKYRKRK